MSTFGDNTARQEIFEALEYTKAKQIVHPLEFLQMVLEVVTLITSEYATEADPKLGWGKPVMIRTEVNGQYVDAEPYKEV